MSFTSVTVYFAAFLFCRYKLFKEYTLPEGVQQCFGLLEGEAETNNYYYYQTIVNYRYFECFVFFAQVISLFIYVVTSMLFLEVKRCLKKVDGKDPF